MVVFLGKSFLNSWFGRNCGKKLELGLQHVVDMCFVLVVGDFCYFDVGYFDFGYFDFGYYDFGYFGNFGCFLNLEYLENCTHFYFLTF